MKENILNIILFIVVLVTIESTALTCITYYSKNKNMYLLAIGCFIYGIIVPCLILKSLEFEGISTINFIWNLFSTVIMIAIGYLLFNEKLNYIKILSFLSGILSIFLLYMSEL